ncbi:uncharacterized protein LOC18433742 isoform X2 [Amborella trichopoda]|uniref:uncharacterized protein LOC18433742 isoform X2 n=1 Tax=Amborella trichopoda TaxID=13333 RepID=UPI0009C0242A|nr:uncharacterized protein LOC18433742 isoform X2 [Amborella trichopoda]|eukprot:XP_020522297.1 uncharacterized protein LOC18433742 isoform X2 [Amborella trichopoda]
MDQSHHHHRAYTVFTRLAIVTFLAAISAWANYEATKALDISISIEDPLSFSGHRFHQLLASDDRAIRIALEASNFACRILSSDKPVSHVTIQLSSLDMAHNEFIVRRDSTEGHDYTIVVNPLVMGVADPVRAVRAIMHRAMAWVWVWDGFGQAPQSLLAGIAEYVGIAAGFGPDPEPEASWLSVATHRTCWQAYPSGTMASFLRKFMYSSCGKYPCHDKGSSSSFRRCHFRHKHANSRTL